MALPEEIDMSNVARVAEALTTPASRGSTVIIDMSATTFCACAGPGRPYPGFRSARPNLVL